MTISKERLNEIALNTTGTVSLFNLSNPEVYKSRIQEFAQALLKKYEAESAVTYYEYRSWYGENTVTPGWGDWERVKPRDALCTIDDAVTEIQQYIDAGYKYQLRKLIALPLVSSEE
jgi:hypothetical protein